MVTEAGAKVAATMLMPELVMVLQGGIAVIYMLAAALMVLWPRLQLTALMLVVGALLVHVMLFMLRWHGQGQLPLVTRYEDLTVDALFLVVVYLLAQWGRAELRRAAALMLVAAGGLALAALTYSQDFYPWSPALRIFWLQIHAPLNSLAMALATLCASLALLGGKAEEGRCGRLLWWVLLLWSVMVATGAYWAYLAWGRFWGWDPIESWALATALAYAAVCHLMLRPAWAGLRGCRLALLPYAMLLFTTYGLVLVRYSMHGQYLFR